MIIEKVKNLFRREPDWRRPDAIPKEVISKAELDAMEKNSIWEIQKNDAFTPQSLYYIHKYIDAKFSKNDFDVDTAFSKKQNKIDELYAEGLSDIYSAYTGYKMLVEKMDSLSERIARLSKKMDIETPDVITKEYDDSEELFKEIKELPEFLDWSDKK